MNRKLTAAAAAVMLTACIILDSRFTLETTEYSARFDDLPPEFDGFRIAVLSDLHGMSFGEDNSRLIRAVSDAKPDMIAILGDMITYPSDLPAFENLLSGIEGIAPIYCINGNHEWAAHCVDKVRELAFSHGAHVLSNAYEPLYCGSSRIIVCGAEDKNGRADMETPPELAARLRGEYPDDFVLWLYHRNDTLTGFPGLPVDLVLSGHAHGGIVRLPFIGGLLDVHRKLGAEYEKGIYEENNTVMIVSRGLGNSIVVPRFLNRPELVCVTLSIDSKTSD